MAGAHAHYYDAFGLSIASDFPLPELRASEPVRDPDLSIIDRPIGCAIPPREQGVLMDYTAANGVVMAWPEVAGFRIVDEATIWVEKPASTSDRMLAFPLLGPVMAWLLNSRKLYVLHASAVRVNGRTIAFLGDKLAGKSTTAAAFIRAGHSLVTDDLLAISVDAGGGHKGAPLCYPAFPQVKLEETAASAISIAGADAQPLVMEGFAKRQHKLAGMTSAPSSIDCLVKLERGGTAPVLTPFNIPQSIEAVTRFSYMPRFAKAPWSKAEKSRHFSQCVTIADSALVGSLMVPDDLTRLDEMVEYVTGELDSLQP